MGNNVILLVEDNPNDQLLGIRALQSQKITNELITAQDGVEALEYLFGTGRYAGRDVNNVPALILLDLKLPKVSGLEVLRQLRADPRTALVPVVILTSSAEEVDIAAGYSSGCNSYIRKPVDFTEFTEAVKTLGMYWLILNERPTVHPIA